MCPFAFWGPQDAPSPSALSSPQAPAARQRARHLHGPRPPPAARLRVARERMRREARARAALRCVAVWGRPASTQVWPAQVTGAQGPGWQNPTSSRPSPGACSPRCPVPEGAGGGHLPDDRVSTASNAEMRTDTSGRLMPNRRHHESEEVTCSWVPPPARPSQWRRCPAPRGAHSCGHLMPSPATSPLNPAVLALSPCCPHVSRRGEVPPSPDT